MGFPFEYFAAILLITAPMSDADFSQLKQETKWTPILTMSVQQIALKLEVLDQREARYILNRPEDFWSDMNLIRNRYQELRDAPPVSDSLRFPEREMINELLSFNRANRQYLSTKQDFETRKFWYWSDLLTENEQLYQIWDAARDARCEYYYVTVRRQALVRLKTMLGEKDYYSGQLPPPVAVWRFQDLDRK